MKTTLLGTAFLLLLTLSSQADIYIYNTTDERLTYEVALPNGDTKNGEITEDKGYGPSQTTISTVDGTITTFKIMSESGGSGVEAKGSSSRAFMLAIVDGSMRLLPVGWTLDNGQSHKREMTIFNATGKAQTFDIIDEKEVRKGFTLDPGKSQTFPAKNGFSGSSGFHTLRFADGKRVETQARSGGFVLLYNDKRYPGEVKVQSLCHITAPRGEASP